MEKTKPILPSWIWIAYVILFLFSVPWYLNDTLAMHLFLGLPLWIDCSVFSIFLIAIFTIWVIRFKWDESSYDEV